MSSISYRTEARVGLITISRPQRRNALNHSALDDIHEALHRARDEDLRALVLTGSDGHFCAGADLTELEDLAFTDALRSMLDDLAALRFPTIAAIAGSCMGLGVQLALACDLRVATTDARFAVPVAKLGLMVDHWTIRRLSLCAGHSGARWMLLSARPVDADAALRFGLVQQLHDGGEDPGGVVLGEAMDLAAEISSLAPLALRGSKLGLDLLEDPATATDQAGTYRAAFERAWSSEDLIEGRRAFRERRSPTFGGY
ncbi:MAG: enoyl-CoA hydratase-related protein [Microthrixaceae bacterium]